MPDPTPVRQLPIRVMRRLWRLDDAGVLRWKIDICNGNVRSISVGSEAAPKRRHVTFKGIRYKKSRLIYKLMTGKEPPVHVDHRDMNWMNNHPDNLRAATNAQNLRNRGPQKNNKLGVKGVCRVNGRRPFLAQIMIPGGRANMFLGYFATLEEAQMAYAAAAEKYHGEFSRTKG